jgi:membrane-bound serine protease (ClpP class)
LRGLCITFIFLGIYFELQSPGIGFALVIAIIAALLYFAPLYVEGLAANWEILLFVIGLILIALEIFVVPRVWDNRYIRNFTHVYRPGIKHGEKCWI